MSLSIVLYNDHNKCTLDRIRISNIGGCESSIVVDIDDEFIAKIKKDALANIDKRTKKV